MLPQKALYWKKTETLLVADVHLGKVAHFRQSGIGIPAGAGHETFLLLHKLIREKQPRRVLFLGDLFHSRYNSDFDKFRQWRGEFPAIEFMLILGNHEVESQTIYQNLGLTLVKSLEEGPFQFTHQPCDSMLFNLAGHLHPGVSLPGSGRQRVKVPCFWFGEHFGVLPAFGEFTGTHPIRPKNGDQVFVLAGSKVIPVSTPGILA